MFYGFFCTFLCNLPSVHENTLNTCRLDGAARWSLVSVSRSFLGEIAKIGLQDRRFRHCFRLKSRKNRQIFTLIPQKKTPHYIFIAFLCIKIFQKWKKLNFFFHFVKNIFFKRSNFCKTKDAEKICQSNSQFQSYRGEK